MKLSVIIPCFNGAKTIATQLEALANQHWSEPWEVIVADNGSTDETRQIIEQYRGRLPNLRIVDAVDRRSAAYARNVGAQAATGEALAFCDADDEVAPGWVAAISEALSRHDFVASRLEVDRLNQPWTIKTRGRPQHDGIQEYKYPPFLPHASTSGLGVKHSLHEAIDGFDETLIRLEDTDYCWRLQLAGTKLHFVPEAVVHYRYRDSWMGMFHQARLWGKCNVLLYKKYRPLGMPKLSWKKGVKAWVRLLRRLPQALRNGEMGRWVWRFAWRIGRLQGCVKYRLLAL